MTTPNELSRKYLPKPTGLDQELYVRSIEAGRLVVQRCNACGHAQHPPRRFCGSCAAPDLGWVTTSGRATVHGYTVVHFPYDRGWAEEVPHAVVVAELEEGPRVVGRYDGPLDELGMDLPLAVGVDPQTDSFAYITLVPD
jgi:uncharacterized protein